MSKGYDYIVAKIHLYDLIKDTIIFVYSYLKRRKQGVIINDIESLFRILLSGAPQGLIPGQILFTNFLIDLFLFVTDAKIANFADENTIYVAYKHLEKFLKAIEDENEVAIHWFSVNDVTVNPRKFQIKTVGRGEKIKDKHFLKITQIL